jgi:hypothetical protein
MPVCIGKTLVFNPGSHRVVVLLLIMLPNHFIIHSGIFCSYMLCSSRAGTTLSKKPVISSDSSIATLSLSCHVA